MRIEKMSWDEFSIEIARSNIACNRRIVRTNFGLILLNVGLCAWNIYNLCTGFSHWNWLTGIGIGCTGTTSIWVWINMWETRLDMKLEKDRLARLEQRREERLAKGADEQHENAINYYTKYVQEAMAREKAKNSEAENKPDVGTGAPSEQKSDGVVCNQADVQNCH